MRLSLAGISLTPGQVAREACKVNACELCLKVLGLESCFLLEVLSGDLI